MVRVILWVSQRLSVFIGVIVLHLLVVKGGFLSSELAGVHYVCHTLAVARVWLWSGIFLGGCGDFNSGLG